jgi:hypothetical protein
MDYLASIRKKERENLKHILKETKKELCESVQDEKNELNELSPWLRDGEGDIEMSPVVARATPLRPPKGNLQLSDVVIEPAAMNATPIYWEWMSTGDILGPAQPDLLAKVGSGLQASYWVVVIYQREPVWINADSLRSTRQFEAQVRQVLPTANPIAQVPTVKPKPDTVEQSSLAFSEGRERMEGNQ